MRWPAAYSHRDFEKFYSAFLDHAFIPIFRPHWRAIEMKIRFGEKCFPFSLGMLRFVGKGNSRSRSGWQANPLSEREINALYAYFG